MTREDTQKLLAMISATYPNFNVHDKTATVQVWSALLEPFDNTLIGKAFIHYAKTNTSGFAPTPSQIIDCAYELSADKAIPEGEAWHTIMKAIGRGSAYYQEDFDALPEPLKQYVGSPWQLHIWATSEDFNETVERSLFVKKYKSICEDAKKKAILNGLKSNLAITESDTKCIEDKN